MLLFFIRIILQLMSDKLSSRRKMVMTRTKRREEDPRMRPRRRRKKKGRGEKLRPNFPMMKSLTNGH
jgi:hypothetical protein